MVSFAAHRLCVVVPAYSEGRVIGETLRALRLTFPNVVVVDDCSPDNTADEALKAGAVVVRHPINLGQGAALQTGMEYALANNAEFIATFDADGQHQASDLAMMFNVLKEKDLDIVLASRFLGSTEHAPRLRRAVLRAAVMFTNYTSGLRLTDTHNGLRVMTADAARRIDLVQNRMAHASEMINQIARLKLRYQEIPATILYSQYSRNKGQRVSASFRILADLMMDWLAR